jgi:hypothetical protein
MLELSNVSRLELRRYSSKDRSTDSVAKRFEVVTPADRKGDGQRRWACLAER